MKICMLLSSSHTHIYSIYLKRAGTIIRDQSFWGIGLSWKIAQITPISFCRDERNSDQDLAAFLNEIHPQSLKSFKTIRYGNFGPNGFRALNSHGESLIELNLHGLSSRITPKISLLKGCTNLVSLSLDEHRDYSIDLERLHYDAFIETVIWLKECKKLRTLAFTHFLSAPPLMIRAFSDNSIQLTSIEYKCLEMPQTDKFYQALANQTSLQKFRLDGSIWHHSQENGVLVESLSRLVNLKFLDLKMLSGWIVDRHIIQLASSLPKLEVWLVDGYRLTHAVWGEFASLRSLQRLELEGSMRFMAGSICGFIEKLGPGNKGLVLSMTNVAQKSNLSGEEKGLIRDLIDKKVQARFEFTLWKGEFWHDRYQFLVTLTSLDQYEMEYQHEPESESD